jgi:hypothetical protein
VPSLASLLVCDGAHEHPLSELDSKNPGMNFQLFDWASLKNKALMLLRLGASHLAHLGVVVILPEIQYPCRFADMKLLLCRLIRT